MLPEVEEADAGGLRTDLRNGTLDADDDGLKDGVIVECNRPRARAVLGRVRAKCRIR